MKCQSRQVFGIMAMSLLGRRESHNTVPGLSPCTHFPSNWLPMHFLGSSTDSSSTRVLAVRVEHFGVSSGLTHHTGPDVAGTGEVDNGWKMSVFLSHLSFKFNEDTYI